MIDANGYFPAGSTYTGVSPVRLLETRSGPGLGTVDGQFLGGGELADGSTLQLVVAGRAGIPVDAATVSLNVTVVGPVGSGFVTIFPCGSERPNASNLNFVAGSVVPNAVLSKVGVGGAVCVFTMSTTHLVIDANGYFPATAT